MKVVYHRGALRDLKSIHSYVATDDPAAADRVVLRIRRIVALLSTQSQLGRPGRRGTRYLSVAQLPYVIIYRVEQDAVRIFAVFYTARNRRF
jgi:toxin ParE1/3/4